MTDIPPDKRADSTSPQTPSPDSGGRADAAGPTGPHGSSGSSGSTGSADQITSADASLLATPGGRGELRTRVQGGPLAPLDASPDERRAEFVAWWLLAARLAALGDESGFRTWPTVAKRLDIDAVQAIAEAARIGVATLDDGAGEPLADAIIDAEDAACLLDAESRLTGLLPHLGGVVQAWIDTASARVLDEDAAEIIAAHAATYPIESSVRLPVVQTPLSALEMLVAAASVPASKPIRLAAVFEFEESLALFHDGRPTEAMRRRFAERQGDGVTPEKAMFRVTPQLDEFWAVVVRVSGEAARRIRTVRLGSWPLQRVPEIDAHDPSVASVPSVASDTSEASDEPEALFETVLAGLPFADRMRLIRAEIGITTTDGGRFVL